MKAENEHVHDFGIIRVTIELVGRTRDLTPSEGSGVKFAVDDLSSENIESRDTLRITWVLLHGYWGAIIPVIP